MSPIPCAEFTRRLWVSIPWGKLLASLTNHSAWLWAGIFFWGLMRAKSAKNQLYTHSAFMKPVQSEIADLT